MWTRWTDQCETSCCVDLGIRDRERKEMVCQGLRGSELSKKASKGTRTIPCRVNHERQLWVFLFFLFLFEEVRCLCTDQTRGERSPQSECRTAHRLEHSLVHNTIIGRIPTTVPCRAPHHICDASLLYTLQRKERIFLSFARINLGGLKDRCGLANCLVLYADIRPEQKGFEDINSPVRSARRTESATRFSFTI